MLQYLQTMPCFGRAPKLACGLLKIPGQEPGGLPDFRTYFEAWNGVLTYWVLKETHHRRRYLPLCVLYKKMTFEQHNIMLAINCITGCDKVSFLFEHGKKLLIIRIMMQKAGNCQDLAGLGTKLEMTRPEVTACAAFCATLYGNPGCTLRRQLNCFLQEMSTHR